MNTSLVIAPDGFLWWKGAKLQCRLVAGGLEFFEKDPRRAAACGGPLFVVPFEAILALCVQVRGLAKNAEVIQAEGKDGEYEGLS